jgi:hypothetical protein
MLTSSRLVCSGQGKFSTRGPKTKNSSSKYDNTRSSNGRKKKKIVGNLGGGWIFMRTAMMKME